MRHPLSLFIIALMTATTVVMGAVIFSSTPSAQAQFGPEPETVALQVYETLPEFPRENQYVHRKKKEVVEDNTLVSRLIRYHTYNQSRSPQYRLDWKITLADYLGLNQYINPNNYPGAVFLKDNPFERDRAIIQGLNREERNVLIQAIVDTYDLGAQETRSPAPPEPSTAPPAREVPSENAIDLLGPAAPSQATEVEPSGPARFLLQDEAP